MPRKDGLFVKRARKFTGNLAETRKGA